ncbi:MAG: glycosyltransferase [Dehalococcoidia bacterium]|nr:glycosyltransferase [Dehalococcoidia bacterium]
MRILGVRVDNLSLEEALNRIKGLILNANGGHVVTVNPEFVIQARSHQKFMDVLNGADLALADGVGITFAARLLGEPLKARLPGVDMLLELTAAAAKNRHSIFLLGGVPGVADKAAGVLGSLYPGLKIAGVYSGSPDGGEEDAIIEMVSRASPNLLFVAYGAPGQDLWIHRNLDRLRPAVAMGVGGSFDYISGRAKRAPEWMRQLGLEWLFRLVRQPWRWKRMLRLPVFAYLILISLLKLDKNHQHRRRNES